VFIRDSRRKPIEEAHAEYLDHLTNALEGQPIYGIPWPPLTPMLPGDRGALAALSSVSDDEG
jgi:hypothetical protein